MPNKHALIVLSLVAAALGTASLLTATRTPEPVVSLAEVNHAQVWATTLPDLAQQPRPIKQWQGKVLVLNFWAPWCPPCRKEIPGFMNLQARLGGKGLQIVGVALDDIDKVRAYVDETGMDYPILLGDMKAVELGQAAGNRLGGLPYSVVFDRQGKAVATLVGEVSESRLESLVQPLL
jgi:thiol-disulfide isomerase/thioredoxin